MKRIFITLVFICAALSFLISTPAFSERLSGLYNASENHQFAPVPKTGQTYSGTGALPGDDGDLQKGIPWPNPRFTDNGDGTVTDNLTALVWMQYVNQFPNSTWTEAIAICNALEDGDGGLMDGSVAGDWRVPSVRELQSVIDYGRWAPALPDGHPFIGTPVYNTAVWVVWSSTLYTYSVNTSHSAAADRAWTVNIPDGGTDGWTHPITNEWNVWCVRDLKNK